jgi:glycosyltransferase involved in cell wall biosynthesis
VAPEVSVVVSTFRRSRNLPRLVAALEAQTLDPSRFEVVIVDNGSGDDTSDVLAELAARTPIDLRPLRIEDNHGPAPARNLGWQRSRGEYVAFTDDDCVPRPDWLEQALATCRATPELGVLQGATLRPAGAVIAGPGTVFRHTIEPSPYFEGCNLVFPRAVLDRTGGFDESYHFGGEDTAAGWSAIELGEWVFDETAVVEHDVGERPLKWHLMMAWREGNLVDVAGRYPELRARGFWKPWAHRPWNVAFAAGVVGTVAAARRPVALVAWLPWLWFRRPSGTRRPDAAAHVLGWRFLNDAVVFAGMVRASARNRTVVL